VLEARERLARERNDMYHERSQVERIVQPAAQ
jgi:hypothetical protein